MANPCNCDHHQASIALNASTRTTRRIDSAALLDGEQEIIICHNQQEYRLRLTRQDKLILTK